MSRKTLIYVHLYLASFLAAPLIIMGLSGGLYLLGIGGDTKTETVFQADGVHLDLSGDDIDAQVAELFSQANITHDYEYIRTSGTRATTRPTSRTFYVLQQSDRQLVITREVPDLQKVMIELHKGHGPGLFKTFEKLLAVGLLLIVISGLWLGIANKGLRNKTLGAFVAGLLITLLLALM